MRSSHLLPPKRNFKLAKAIPKRNDPADTASAIAQLQQNQALIIEAINALNANLSLTLGLVISVTENVALSDTTGSGGAIAGDILSVAAGWTPMPSGT